MKLRGFSYFLHIYLFPAWIRIRSHKGGRGFRIIISIMLTRLLIEKRHRFQFQFCNKMYYIQTNLYFSLYDLCKRQIPCFQKQSFEKESSVTYRKKRSNQFYIYIFLTRLLPERNEKLGSNQNYLENFVKHNDELTKFFVKEERYTRKKKDREKSSKQNAVLFRLENFQRFFFGWYFWSIVNDTRSRKICYVRFAPYEIGPFPNDVTTTKSLSFVNKNEIEFSHPKP